jgi:hypothetical protein
MLAIRVSSSRGMRSDALHHDSRQDLGVLGLEVPKVGKHAAASKRLRRRGRGGLFLQR